MQHGRVFRKLDGDWQPIGEPLPEWPHVPTRTNDPMAVWVLPRDLRVEAGDVVVLSETAHRMLAPTPPEDAAWAEVINSALSLHDATDVREWIAGVELWMGMRLDGDWRSGR